jgi:hypothetical protein
MAQTGGLSNVQLRPRFQLENTAAVTIPATGNTEILTMMLEGAIEHLAVSITVAVHSIDGFLVEVQFHPDGSWVTLTSSITSTPAGLILSASGTLASQAVGTGWFVMDTRGIYGVRISASGSVDDTTTVLARAFGS